MLNFIIKYLTELVFLSIAFLLAAMLSSDTLLIAINYDFGFIMFFSSLFALMLPAYYLAVKYC